MVGRGSAATVRAGAVLIAEDDRRSSAVVAAALQRAGYSTVEVGTGGEALEVARGGAADLLLLEVTLPDMTGYEVCRMLRDEGHEMPIFFLSGRHTDSVDRVAGLLLGADDFLVKPFDPNELVARVYRHVRRRATPPRLHAPAAPALTRREEEILRLLTRGQRQKAIANELSISPKTVATHIQNVFGKLGVHSRAELVARAYLLGLVESGGGRRLADERPQTVPQA
jgi:DNA-binding NarL/FixJ family response regulator